jgi:UDP-GlcNAc:undecaprenyl-phosphate GlcNAc-1-phosphate transferase
MQLIAPAAASFGLCVLAIIALRPVAVAIDLIDRPGGRKTHHGEIPIVGGLAMLLGMILGLGLLPAPGNAGGAFLAGCGLLVTIGLIDDRFDLSPWMRIPGQMAAASILMVGSGAMVTTLGDPFGIGVINLGDTAGAVFTVVITIAAINAFNMLDGMDGLAGTTALTALLASAYLAASAGRVMLAAASLVIAGAVCAFLLFNLPTRLNRVVRCFMGDAGSTLLGFSVAWLCIELSQGSSPVVAPVTTWWIVALPLFELVWTTLRRIIRGVSPFKADRDHFHHLLLKAGFSVRGAFGVFVAAAVLLASLGIMIDRSGVPDLYSFLLLIAAGVGTVVLMYRARVLRQLLPESLARPPLPEEVGEK